MPRLDATNVQPLRRSILFSFIEKYSALFINIVTVMILARLLTPAETGIYSVASGLANIAQTIREFGVGSYILQEQDLTKVRLRSALGVSVALGTAITIIFLAAAEPIAHIYGEPRLETIIRTISPSFICVGFASIGVSRLYRDMNFKGLMRIGIAQAIVSSTVSIFLAAEGLGAEGMAYASLSGILVSLLGNYFYYPHDLFLVPSLVEWRKICGYGSFATGSHLLEAISQRLPDIIISRVLGFEAAGLFSRGNGFITLFQQALMTAVIPVAASGLATISRAREDLRGPVVKFLSYSTAVAWPVLGMIFILCQPIIRIAFGPQWLAAVLPARVLCVAGACAVVGQVGTTLFSATGAVRWMMVVQAAALPIEVVAMLVGCRFGIATAAAGVVGGSIVLAALSVVGVRRATGLTWGPIVETARTSLLVTAATLALPLWVVGLNGIPADHALAMTLVVGFCGMLSWFGSIFAVRHPLRIEIMGVIRHILPTLLRRRWPEAEARQPRPKSERKRQRNAVEAPSAK